MSDAHIQHSFPKSRAPYLLAALFYFLNSGLSALVAFTAPILCFSRSCVKEGMDTLLIWALSGMGVSFLIAIIAIVTSKSRPRIVTWLLILYPFIFWGIYIALMNAANML